MSTYVEGKWSLTDFSNQLQLGSPGRLVTQRKMIQFSSNKDDITRIPEQQLQESPARQEVQRRAGDLQTQVDDANRRAEPSNRRAEASYRRAGELQTQVQGSEERVEELQRSLAETSLELRQCEDQLQVNSTHRVIRREVIELTVPELGVGG